MTTNRQTQISQYLNQLDLVVAAKKAFEADIENEALGNELQLANNVLNAMFAAGYRPQVFGADSIETGEETPEGLAEMANLE